MTKASVQTSDRARRALSSFRTMQPALTSFARALANDSRINLEVSSTGGYTDGTRIYYRPPLALGDNLVHSRNICNVRGEDRLYVCKACAVREEVLVTIYHELGHIVFKSFDSVKSSDVRKAIEFAVAEITNPKLKAGVRHRIENLSQSDRFNYIELATSINPFLKFLVNCIEDARIDSAMFQARRGVRTMKSAQLQSILVNGVENNEGGYALWNTAPLNGQAAIACYFEAISLVAWREHFHESVSAAFDDERLKNILSTVPDAADVAESYSISITVLEVLREYGFFKSDNPEDEADDDEQDTDEQPGDGEPSEAGSAGESDSDDEREPDSDPVSSETGAPGVPEDQSVPEQREGGDPEAEESESAGGGEDQSDDDGSESPISSDDDGPEEREGNEARDNEAEPEGSSNDSGQLDPTNEETDADTDDEPQDGAPESDVGPADEPIDTGADEGRGGVQLNDTEVDKATPDYGEPADIIVMEQLFHNDEVEVVSAGEEKALEVAIIQGLYFEKPSQNVAGVRVHQYDTRDGNDAWGNELLTMLGKNRTGVGNPGDFNVSETIVGPALLACRRIFSDNAIAAHQHNRRSGRIHRKVLGRRAWSDDDRLFTKKRLPGKRSYAVVIGIDISGSTFGQNLVIAKKAAWAQAELCHRLGIQFAIYAHTAASEPDFSLDVYEIKRFEEPWDKATRVRLDAIGPHAENLDGHGIEFYRKRLDEIDATDKILLYYTDGKMPAANYDEELEILQREIKMCARKGYHLMGVGIRTDSPRRHGLDTVQINSEEELKAVVHHLEKRLVT